MLHNDSSAPGTSQRPAPLVQPGGVQLRAAGAAGGAVDGADDGVRADGQPHQGRAIGVEEQVRDRRLLTRTGRQSVAVEEHHAAGVAGLVQHRQGGYGSTAGVTDQYRLGQVQRLDERVELPRLMSDVEGRDALGVAPAVDVDGINPMPLRGQKRREVLPGVRRLDEAVHQHDRRPTRAPLAVAGRHVTGLYVHQPCRNRVTRIRRGVVHGGQERARDEGDRDRLRDPAQPPPPPTPVRDQRRGDLDGRRGHIHSPDDSRPLTFKP